MNDYSAKENNGYKEYNVNDNINNTYKFIVKNANEYNVILEMK